MLDATDAPAGCVALTEERASRSIGYDCWNTLYLPTRVRWGRAACIPRVIAYQLDGRSAAHLKNLPRPEESAFRAWAQDGGHSLVRVGQPYTIEQCIRMLAMAERFVGVCSGMGMLALSVGVPTYILEYEVRAAFWYGPNPARIVRGVDGLRAQVEHEENGSALPVVGSWRSSRGYCVHLHPGGGATWEHGHRVGGHWHLTEQGHVHIAWDNGHVYVLRPSASGVDGEERSRDGAVQAAFTASREA